jgi:(E)-4-hydroxy-3-methylbut-2-enyl-diphosphate synthase
MLPLVPVGLGARMPYVADPFAYRRRRTREVRVGNVGVGGGNPIRIQSMTTTRTTDTAATVAQIIRLVEAGCEIVRVTTPTVQDARHTAIIKAELRRRGIDVPLVADIHFSPHAAMEAALHVEKVRINPGNYADSRQFAIREYSDAEYQRELERIFERVTPLILRCKERGIAMRIGTNHGSLSDRIMNRYGDTPLGMVESALEFVRICEYHGYRDIILSMKASNPKVMIEAYRLLVARMDREGMDYPLHLGVTEAGNAEDGRIKSAIGIGTLLEDGLGDTIRVSLTEEPENEIPVARLLARRYDERLRAASRPYEVRSAQSADGGQGSARRPCPADAGAYELAGGARPRPREARDPYSYQRRATRRLAVGRLGWGGREPVRVVMRAPTDVAQAVALAAPSVDPVRPDAYIVDGPQAGALRAALAAAGSDTALLATSVDAAPAADGLWLDLDGVVPSRWLEETRRAAASGRPVVLVASDEPLGDSVERLVATVVALRRAGYADLALGVGGADVSAIIWAARLAAARLAEARCDAPLVLIAPAGPGEPGLLDAAVALGSPLSDGIGDAVLLRGVPAPADELRLAFNVLQGAGVRLSKTEFVACPSCGRTLFDLQETTDRIKAKTGHLVGVKIAIMGCIVNGPGEMADADFGYVGGAPGKVNLYVGKECVAKGIPVEEADERLIELIKAHGKWIDPPAR